MLNLPTQHHLCILQRLIVQQPVQFCPLCRGAAVFVHHSDAVDGKGSATLEPSFHPVGVHVVAGGAPQQQNPNFFPIGEGFGFFIFFGNDNSGLFPTAVCSKPYQQSGLDSERQPGGIFEKRNREPWVRRLREMPFPKQLERHFLSFDIRHLLSPKLLPDGTELIRYIRIGHRTGDIHRPSGFGGFIEPAFILHGLQRVL